jgi:hypothetical protein
MWVRTSMFEHSAMSERFLRRNWKQKHTARGAAARALALLFCRLVVLPPDKVLPLLPEY